MSSLSFSKQPIPMAIAIAYGLVMATLLTLIFLPEKGVVKVIGGALSEESGIDGQKFLVSDKAYQAGVRSPKDLNGKKIRCNTVRLIISLYGIKNGYSREHQTIVCTFA